MARVSLEVLPHWWHLLVSPCEINPDAHNGKISLSLKLTYTPKCGDTVYHLGRAYSVVNAEKWSIEASRLLSTLKYTVDNRS